MTKPREPPFGTYAPTAMQRQLLSLAQASFLKRGDFRPFMAWLLNGLRPGPVDLEFMGAAFRLRPMRGSTDLGMVFNPGYNSKEIDFLTAAIPAGGVFVDIGCNIGVYSLTIAKRIAPSGKVIGIEPHPEALRYLNFNLEASQIGNFRVFATAVGDFSGETAIRTDERNLGASAISEGGDIKVPLRPLLSVVQEAKLPAIDALKIDIEGFEDRALLPFFNDAPPELWPKAAVIEHLGRKQWKTDCIALMQDLGYGIVGKTRANTLMLRHGV